MSDRVRGTVKFFDSTKGYGFLSICDRDDVFFHVKSLPTGVTDPQEGDAFSFETQSGTKGLKAVNMMVA